MKINIVENKSFNPVNLNIRIETLEEMQALIDFMSRNQSIPEFYSETGGISSRKKSLQTL